MVKRREEFKSVVSELEVCHESLFSSCPAVNASYHHFAVARLAKDPLSEGLRPCGCGYHFFP